MFPLKDDNPTRSAPVITVGLIALNILAFLYQISLEASGSRQAQAFVMEFGMIPCRLTGYCAIGGGPSATLTIVTSMFLHGGLFHIAGNMLYLWIFGNNVEDTLGHARYLVFYLVSGVAAALMQILVSRASDVPMIGASGAVSGVLGAYLILFPHANVVTLVIFGFFFRVMRIPAVIILGFWIVVQLVNGLGSLGASGGVAWFAHVGGFVAGMVLLPLVKPRPAARSW